MKKGSTTLSITTHSITTDYSEYSAEYFNLNHYAGRYVVIIPVVMILFVITLSVALLGVVMVIVKCGYNKYHYTEGLKAECHYADYQYSDCH
jgi:hypothetical protein